MGQIIVNGGTPIQNYYPGVTVNGTAVQQVVVNGTTIWTRYPYPVGTTVFTYGWSNGSNINNFISSFYAMYPLAFASAPFYTQGSGNPDSRIQFTLFSGFIVSSYTQSQNGTQNMSGGTTGGTYTIYVGSTVSGLSGTNITIPGSGNGGSSFVVTYQGN